MSNKWKRVLGLVLVLIVLLVSPFAWRIFLPYGMMRNTADWHMPMMYGAPGMMALGMMFLIWLVLLVSLLLIGIGIVWLVKENTAQKDF
jgi:hypothetical protein